MPENLDADTTRIGVVANTSWVRAPARLPAEHSPPTISVGAVVDEARVADAVRAEHAERCLRLVEQAAQELELAKQIGWLDVLEQDYDSLSEAMEWLLHAPEARRAAQALRFVSAMWVYWKMRSNLSEALTWMTRALERTSERTRERASVIGAAGMLAIMQGRYEDAQARLEESWAIYKEVDDAWGQSESLVRLGKLAQKRGLLDAARDFYSQCLDLSRQAGFGLLELSAINNLGLVAYDCGDYDLARALHQECLDRNHTSGNAGGFAWSLNNLAETALAQFDLEEAYVLASDSLQRFHQLRSHGGVAANTMILGEIQWQSRQTPDDREQVVRLFGAAKCLCDAVSMTEAFITTPSYYQILDQARAEMCEDTFEAAWEMGRKVSLDEAVCLAAAVPRP